MSLITVTATIEWPTGEKTDMRIRVVAQNDQTIILYTGARRLKAWTERRASYDELNLIARDYAEEEGARFSIKVDGAFGDY